MNITNRKVKVAAVVLNYNSWEDTERCVADLEKQTNIENIIIVDNCSPNEDERTHLNSIANRNIIKLLLADYNNGYNAGNNIGIKYAIENGVDYILVANPDMRFPDIAYIEKLLESFKDSSVVVVGSDVITPEGHHQNPMTKTKEKWQDNFSWIKNLFSKKKGKTYQWNDSPEDSCYCTSLNGCCLLIRSSFLKNIGYFDERVFLFGEERILGSQVQSLDLKMFYNGSVTAIHNHKQNKEGNQWNRLNTLKKSEKIFIRYHAKIPLFVKPLVWGIIELKYLLLYFKYHSSH